MATFNGGSFLEDQLESIAAQDRRPDEIVIGDDQSTDATLPTIEKFARRHPEMTIRVERNRERLGSSRNFEETLQRCTGDIIFFSDQDDLWLASRFSRAMTVFESNPNVSFVFSDGNLIGDDGALLRGTLFSSIDFTPRERLEYRSGNAISVLLRHNVVTGAALAVRRAPLLRILPFESGWIHDYYIALTLEILGNGVLIDEPLIHYRRHGAQQVGVAGSGVFQALLYARRQDASYCREEARKFRSLRNRLPGMGVAPSYPVFRQLEEKARFLDERVAMRSKPWMAPGILLRALCRGSYQRYSLGWKQVVVDALAVGIAAVSR